MIKEWKWKHNTTQACNNQAWRKPHRAKVVFLKLLLTNVFVCIICWCAWYGLFLKQRMTVSYAWIISSLIVVRRWKSLYISSVLLTLIFIKLIHFKLILCFRLLIAHINWINIRFNYRNVHTFWIHCIIIAFLFLNIITIHYISTNFSIFIHVIPISIHSWFKLSDWLDK